MNVRQIFLLIVAIGLIPIALSYGAFPQQTLPFLFDITVINTNGTHIFRALMALYLGFALFWILGAFNTGLGHVDKCLNHSLAETISMNPR